MATLKRRALSKHKAYSSFPQLSRVADRSVADGFFLFFSTINLMIQTVTGIPFSLLIDLPEDNKI